MKVGIISDIHGNYHALEAVAKELQEEKVNEVWCLGDVVGYGAFPNECLEWVFENCSQLVLGNHELALLGFVDITTFSEYAAKAILWTRKKIKPSFLKRLMEVGIQAFVGDYQLVHDTPSAPGSMEYILSTEEAYSALLKQARPVCFFAHTHIPVAFKLKGAHSVKLTVSEITLKPGRYLINPGSVGQPRDGNPEASFIILSENKVLFRRKRYDVKSAAKAILKEGLPEFLAARLLVGV